MIPEPSPNCRCENLTIIKKGYSISKGLTVFIALGSIFFLLLFFILRYEDYLIKYDADFSAKYRVTDPPDPDRYNRGNMFLFIAGGALTCLGFIAGTHGMNDLYNVCPKCGKQSLLKTNK